MTDLDRLVAGIDFGSDAVRVKVVDAGDGATIMTVSRSYPRWAAGLYCDPKENRFRQHPLDYIETLEACFHEIADELGDGAVSSLAVDATGSTPAPVDERGRPLALSEEFRDDPDAMFWLWKDRTSVTEARIVNDALSSAEPDHTQFQGVYSSEWWWAKILRAITTNERILERARSWVEHSDWLPNMLVGRDNVGDFARNACAAGHKALFSARLGGMIPRPLLESIHPYLASVSDTYLAPPAVAGTRLGTLTPEWAQRLRLTSRTVVAVGSLDAHAGGVGAGIDRRSLVKVMGTSTVDLFLTDYDVIQGHDVRRVCGIAENSIIPGHLGGETSQAAFGDLFAWYSRMLAWPIDNVMVPQLREVLPERDLGAARTRALESLLSSLEAEVAQRGSSEIIALDWINGRRYPDVDESATAALVDLRIGHDAADVYRALVQSAVLGSKAIYEALAAEGIAFERVILVGGIAQKSPLICQMMADALDMPVVVSEEDEACATGAAIFAATAAGYFDSVPEAQALLVSDSSATYRPTAAGVREFGEAFSLYQSLGTTLSDRSDGVIA